MRDQNRLNQESKRGVLDGTMETGSLMVLRRGNHDVWTERTALISWASIQIPQGRNVREVFPSLAADRWKWRSCARA